MGLYETDVANLVLSANEFENLVLSQADFKDTKKSSGEEKLMCKLDELSDLGWFIHTFGEKRIILLRHESLVHLDDEIGSDDEDEEDEDVDSDEDGDDDVVRALEGPAPVGGRLDLRGVAALLDHSPADGFHDAERLGVHVHQRERGIFQRGEGERITNHRLGEHGAAGAHNRYARHKRPPLEEPASRASAPGTRPRIIAAHAPRRINTPCPAPRWNAPPPGATIRPHHNVRNPGRQS